MVERARVVLADRTDGRSVAFLSFTNAAADELASRYDAVVYAVGDPNPMAAGGAGAAEDEVQKIALADPHVMAHLEGLTVRKVIVVKDRIVNIVAN